MSLFKLLLRMFNLLRNSRHSSCYHICRAWGVHFVWFIRLDNVQWFSLGKSKHSDIADISWYISYIYIYISDMLLISCCCVSAPACSFGSVSMMTCWAEGRGVAAPGHLGSIGWEPQLLVATWAMPQCCARAQGGHRRLKTSQVLWWRLLLLLCHSMSWFTLCSNFLEMLFFHQKMIHSSQQLGLDSEGKQEVVCEVVQFVNKTLNWREGESFKKL